jgi:hypothetical protein
MGLLQKRLDLAKSVFEDYPLLGDDERHWKHILKEVLTAKGLWIILSFFILFFIGVFYTAWKISGRIKKS